MNPGSKCEYRSLPLEIHAATRSCHTALNRLIISRLPLCLPPHAANPAIYAEGIAAFSRIYLLFEQAWDEILTGRPGKLCIHEALRQLKIPSLSRSAKLEADLSLLNQRLDGQGKSYNEEHGELAPLLDRTREAILERPHVILSYTWVMYMALFNGGRWIRDQLNQGGPDLWGSHTQSFNIDCLSFWNFEGELDGEDIKDDFKARFNKAVAVLDDTERQDVIDESVRIFETCSQMVAWLDRQTRPRSPELIVPEAQSWLAASYATASSTVCGIWSGLIRAMPSLSTQRSELQLEPSRNAS